ncbi:MAG: type VI-B CRISPR-associated RNA-guided ribonuclease Cas13b [Bacteroidota bacterium]
MTESKTATSVSQELKDNYGHVFAAYLNMAQHNAFNILSNISKQMEIEDEKLKDDSGIASAATLRMLSPMHNVDKTNEPIQSFDVFIQPDAIFADGRVLISLEGKFSSTNAKTKQKHQYIPPDQLPYLISRLKHHFPFLPDNIEIEEMGGFLQNTFHRLRQERNFFTHFAYKKDRSKFTTVDVEPYCKKAFEKLILHIENGLKTGNDPYRGFDATLLGTTFGQANINQLKPFENEILIWEKTEDDFTTFGLAFFICLFLEKKYATQFLAKIALSHSFSTLEKRLLEEWFWQYCCRMPRPRLESSDPILDMLNELGRCPKNIYHHLSESDKALFHIKPEIAGEPESPQDEIVKFIRFNDRFAYLALQYLDISESFDRLRFQIHLGKYLKKTYEKQGFGTRKIYQNLRTFGRLSHYQDHENHAPSDWKKRAEDIKEPSLWYIDEIEQFGPRYQITGNRIGIKIFDQKVEKESWWSLADYARESNHRQKHLQPDFILSTNDLPNLFFYQYLYEQQKEPLIADSAEDFLEKYAAEFHTFVEMAKKGKIKRVERLGTYTWKGKQQTDIKKFHKKPLFPFEKPDESKKGKDKNVYTKQELDELESRKEELQASIDQHFSLIKVGHLPDSLREYLLGYKIEKDQRKLKRRLITRRNKAEKRLRALEREAKRIAKIIGLPNMDNIEDQKLLKKVEKELEKGNYVPVEAKWRVQNGEIADWLVRDMIFLKPRQIGTKNDGMPNGQETSRLQKALAYYSMYKREVKDMFNQLGFDKGSYPHPFLDKIQYGNYDSVRSLYEAYLREKIDWLDEILWQQSTLRAFETIETSRKNRGKDLLALKKKHLQDEVNKADNETLTWAEELLDALKEQGVAVIDEFSEKYEHCISFYDNESKAALEKDYSKTPLMVPRGLFLEPIKIALQKQGYIVAKTDSGITSMLKIYFEKKQQKLYDLYRTYADERVENVHLVLNGQQKWKEKTRVLQKELDDLEQKKKTSQDQKLEEEDFQKWNGLKNIFRQARKHEKSIRYTLACDRVLMLMIHNLCEQKENFQLGKNDLKLQRIDTPNEPSNLLNIEVEMSVSIAGRKVVDRLSIRRYGDFRRFFKDKRVAVLLQYFPEGADVHRKILLEELDYFDRHRPAFFEAVLSFEEALLNRFPTLIKGMVGNSFASHSRQLFKLREVERKMIRFQALQSKGEQSQEVEILGRELNDLGLKATALEQTIRDSFTNVKTLSDEAGDPIERLLIFRNKFAHNEIPLSEELLAIQLPTYHTEEKIVDEEIGYTETYYRIGKNEKWITQQIIDLAIENYQQLAEF